MRTYRGGFLPTIIQAETTNRFVYTGKSRQCGKLDVFTDMHYRTKSCIVCGYGTPYFLSSTQFLV